VRVTEALRKVQEGGEDLTITVIVSTDPSIKIDDPILDFTSMQVATFD
jgi:hypothetical protein